MKCIPDDMYKDVYHSIVYKSKECKHTISLLIGRMVKSIIAQPYGRYLKVQGRCRSIETDLQGTLGIKKESLCN